MLPAYTHNCNVQVNITLYMFCENAQISSQPYVQCRWGKFKLKALPAKNLTRNKH